jgi:hypothetical protein
MVILKTELEQFSKTFFHVSILKQLIALEDFVSFIGLEILKISKLSPPFFLSRNNQQDAAL